MTAFDPYHALGQSASIILVIFSIAFGPIGFIALLLRRQKRLYKEQAKEPFTTLPLRPPGESLRLSIDEINDEISSCMFLLIYIGFVSILTTLLMPSNQRIVAGITSVVITLAVYVYTGRQLLRLVRKRWDYELGFWGERVVGEELNQLLASGFKVFHDVPFEKGKRKFNIDHVLVGPPGVYAVETKARRKSTKFKGLAKATFYSDGEKLTFPDGEDRSYLDQTKLNARDLSEWLSNAVGEPIAVSAVLTLPGWAVQRTKSGNVNVLRPDEIKRSFPTKPENAIDETLILRICHQLTERCRLEIASK